MTGRERIEAAFFREGASQLPTVICYENVFIRDHWAELTSCPWWYPQSPNPDLQEKWMREVVARIGQDWIHLFPFCTADERANLPLEERTDGVYRLNPATGKAQKLSRPQVSGWTAAERVESVHVAELPKTVAQVDQLLSQRFKLPPLGGATRETASRLVERFGANLFPVRHISGPFWNTHALWGFEGMMTLAGSRPDLIQHACDHILARTLSDIREFAAQGVAGVWIEDCFTDVLSPAAFTRLNQPYIHRLVEEIRGCGMKSIYYFTGNPTGKWDLILATGADALSLEESKKDFQIDIAEVAKRLAGRCVLLGNLDATAILQDGTEAQLREELQRQIHAGRKNRSRFIVSLGSPVTPDTPVARVRLYCDLAHELGAQ